MRQTYMRVGEMIVKRVRRMLLQLLFFGKSILIIPLVTTNKLKQM